MTCLALVLHGAPGNANGPSPSNLTIEGYLNYFMRLVLIFFQHTKQVGTHFV